MMQELSGRRIFLFIGTSVHGELSIPNPRPISAAIGQYPVAISSGSEHIAYLTRSGDIHCAGSNRYGQLGTGDITEVSEDEDDGMAMMDINTFGKTECLKDDSTTSVVFTKVICGYKTTAGISDNGQIYIWGFHQTECIPTPKLVLFKEDNIRVLQVGLGDSHVIALTTTSTTKNTSVYTWGHSIHGALGHEEDFGCPHPKLLNHFEGKRASYIAAGATHSGVIADGKLYVFGECDYHTKLYGENDPRLVEISPDEDVELSSKVRFVCFGNRMSFVCVNGSVYGWGKSLHTLRHIAGLPEDHPASTVVLLYSATPSTACIDISCTPTQVSIVTEDGKAYSLGFAKFGALGTGNNYDDHHSFVLMNHIHPVKQLACCTGCVYLLSIPPISKMRLDQIMQFEHGKIPFIIDFIVKKLETEPHCKSEGMFRTTGSTGTIQSLVNAFDTENNFYEIVENQKTDDYAGLLKLFLRQLPEPIIPFGYQMQLSEILALETNVIIRFDRIHSVIQTLPPSHFHLLHRVLLLFHHVASFSEQNKMNVRNLVMCTLTAIYGQNVIADMQRATNNGTLLNLLISDAPLWFGEKELLLPAQIKSVLINRPIIKHIREDLEQLSKIADPVILQKHLISSGAFWELCKSAPVEFDCEEDWLQFRETLQLCLPLTVDSALVFNVVKNVANSDSVSDESWKSLCCLLEYLPVQEFATPKEQNAFCDFLIPFLSLQH